MLIGIDGNEANVKNRVGVNNYAYELLCNIHKLQEVGLINHKIIVYLSSAPLSDLPFKNKKWQYQVIKGRGFWIIRKLMPFLFLSRIKPDVLWVPSHYAPLFAPMPIVCSIMDLGYLESSGQFRRRDFWQLKLWSAWSIIISKHIISISQATMKDIVRHYPFARKKVSITHLGYDKSIDSFKPSFEDVRQIIKKYSIVEDYILFLGTLKPSKNIDGIIGAWSLIHEAYPKVKLVIAGKKGWLFDSFFEKVKKMKLQDRVIFTDFIEEKDKNILIYNSRAFLIPSFWEGFGLDALSAQALGVPVIASNKGSLPEVLGKAGIFVDPYEVTSISEAIKKVLSMNKKDYNKLIEQGKRNAKSFSWERAARETIDILEKSIDEHI